MEDAKWLDEIAEQYLSDKLKILGFNIKYRVKGRSTIFTEREIWLQDWYSGFWGNEFDDITATMNKIENAVCGIVKRIVECCPEKVVALGEVKVDCTEHFETKDKYYCVCVSFGGY